MRVAGIIAEYDPFHNGHKAHVDSVHADGVTHIVTVVSGSFTQRGEPALLTKFDRARMALACGADLVLENPLPFAMASAERFAIGGVSILHALGCVDTLSFGSECGDTAELQELAALMDEPAYEQTLKEALATGISYAAARQKAVELCKGKELAAILGHPNNTLGLEYIRAATKIGANVCFLTLQRIGAAHNAEVICDNIASASHLRTLIRTGQADNAMRYMPAGATDVLREAIKDGRVAVHTETLKNALLARLRTMDLADFASLPYISEGLEHRLYQASRTAGSIDELLDAVKTRRYPTARLQRILWAALLGMPREDACPIPPYIRVLAMNERGREILSAASPALPILTRAAQIRDLSAEAQTLFRLECRATDLHALTLATPLPCGTDLTNKI